MSSDHKPFDVVGVGRVCYDHAVLVDTHPEADSKTTALDHWRGSGSPVPNALCQLSIWGWHTALQAVAGDDHEGELIKEELGPFEVDLTSLQVRSNSRTPLAYIWVEKATGKRTVVLDRDLAPLSADDVSSSQFENARYLLIDGWETEASRKACLDARSSGLDVVLDAGSVRQDMDHVLALSDWIIVPVNFIREYFGSVDVFTAITVLQERGPAEQGGAKGVVVTNGAAGCIALEQGGQPQYFPSARVTAVDTTGAGDVFHAGFIHGLLNEWPFEQCVHWASAAAALSVIALGSRGNLPSASDVEQLLKSF